MLVRWHAQLKCCGSLAGILLFVWMAGLLNLWLVYGQVTRNLVALLLWAAVAVCFWSVRRTWRRRLTPQGVAARIERAFPHLDNHLINYLQFADETRGNVFKQAYIERGLPEWEGLPFDEMKDSRLHRKAHLALLAAAILVLAPLPFVGKAWTVSLWRVVNPFTDIKPVSLTRILSVTPGDGTVLQGEPAVLTCAVKGRGGHRVALDIEPADMERTTHALGKVAASGVSEDFAFKLQQVNTVTRYRFRAGDAPMPQWYTLTPRPPLAFEETRLEILPPAYTGLEPRRYEALDEGIAIPEGSDLQVLARANLPVAELAFRAGETSVPLQSAGDRTRWRGSLTVTNGAPVRMVATGEAGDRAEQVVHFEFEADRLPTIKVLAPEGRPLLGPGAVPEITFTVSDDYGLGEISVEKVIVGASRTAEGEVLHTWKGGTRELTQTWKDTSWHGRSEPVLAYRIVARDNHPAGGDKRYAVSPRILFQSATALQAAGRRNALEKEAFAALSQVIELQRRNIGQTKRYQKNLPESTPAQWKETADRQARIRELTRALIANPLNPLGTLGPTANKLYLNEMMRVIPLLGGVPEAPEALRAGRVATALVMEEKILRQFTFAEAAAARAKVQRRVSALSSMLRALIKHETDILKDTRTCALQSTTVGEVLIDRQDEVALDLTDFVQACRSESNEVQPNDENYARLLNEIAEMSANLKIRDDMMLASEQLEENRPDGAMPFETAAIEKLKQLEARLSEVLAQEGLAEQEALLEAVAEAKKRFEKLDEVFRTALESMEMVGDQKDKSTKDTDLLEEEYEELVKNLKEALLQVPTDLNIFMELNVANDLVEDVFQVFEEIEQAAGSEELSAGDVKERALAKREEYLEGMEEAMDRLDSMESWLDDQPDDMKITAEAFDQEEMPEAGISLGALSTEAEDLIGDLLEKQEDLSEEADDGAINTSVPDMVASDEVKEGDVANFSAQGKSGNETPDHKEQDGRSNVGRQGMATGETAAGSGTVNEGDKNIEERRTQEPTQSGQVDVEGEDIDTKATGGGKLGTGKADDVGMEGGAKRMDSTEEGSAEGLDAIMAKRADAMFAKASLQNVRADSLKDAAHHLRQADDAIARGRIAQLKEHRRLALAALKEGKARIDAAIAGSFDLEATPSFIEDVVEGGSGVAPPKYRDLVAEYYKSLNSNL